MAAVWTGQMDINGNPVYVDSATGLPTTNPNFSQTFNTGPSTVDYNSGRTGVTDPGRGTGGRREYNGPPANYQASGNNMPFMPAGNQGPTGPGSGPGAAPTLAQVMANKGGYAGTSFDPNLWVNPGTDRTGYMNAMGYGGDAAAGVPPGQQTFKPAAAAIGGRPGGYDIATNDADVWLNNMGQVWTTPGKNWGMAGMDNARIFGTDPGNGQSNYNLPGGAYRADPKLGLVPVGSQTQALTAGSGSSSYSAAPSVSAPVDPNNGQLTAEQRQAYQNQQNALTMQQYPELYGQIGGYPSQQQAIPSGWGIGRNGQMKPVGNMAYAMGGQQQMQPNPFMGNPFMGGGQQMQPGRGGMPSQPVMNMWQFTGGQQGNPFTQEAVLPTGSFNANGPYNSGGQQQNPYGAGPSPFMGGGLGGQQQNPFGNQFMSNPYGGQGSYQQNPYGGGHMGEYGTALGGMSNFQQNPFGGSNAGANLFQSMFGNSPTQAQWNQYGPNSAQNGFRGSGQYNYAV